MSRWLSRDVVTMPLAEIEAEIAALQKVPSRNRTVLDVERLADLQEARRRITGGHGMRGRRGWTHCRWAS